MLKNYKKHVAERAKQNIPPLPLDADQTSELIELLKKDHQESDFLLNLLKESDINLNFLSFSFVDQRRWNINLKNGVKILLPETKVLDTLKLLNKVSSKYNILNGNFIEIDMRIYGKYFLKPKIN